MANQGQNMLFGVGYRDYDIGLSESVRINIREITGYQLGVLWQYLKYVFGN